MRLAALALFTRALRLEARSHWTYLVRAGLVVLLILALMDTWDNAAYGGAPGLRFFTWVMYTNLLGITLAGLAYFASAVSEEKESQTLGLLRMTGLSALVLVLGKSTSRLLTAAGLLLVQVPFALLGVALGGILPRQVVASYIALAAYLVLVANLALFFSVIVRRTYHACVLTGAALIVFAMVCAYRPGLSPIERLGDVLSAGWSGPLASPQTWSNAGIGAVLFFLAWMLFDPCTRREGWMAPRGRLLARLPLRLPQIEPGHAWTGPTALVWKDCYFVAGWPLRAVFSWPLLLAGSILAMGYCGIPPGASTREAFASVLVAGSALLLGLGTGWLVACVLQAEVRDRTLPALVLTSLSLGRIVRLKARAVYLCVKPVLKFLALGLLLLAPEWLGEFSDMLRDSLRVGGLGWTFVELGLYVSLVACQVALYLLLVAYLALRMRHGAVALAVVLQFINLWLCAMLWDEIQRVLRHGTMWPLFLMVVVLASVSVLLARGVRDRLRRAVAA